MLTKFLQMDNAQRIRYVGMRGVMGVVGTFLGITTMVSMSADEAIAPLEFFADVKYTDTFWHMNGDVGITGLSIKPMGGDNTENISVERITVHTPGFIWLARAAAASRKEELPEFDAEGQIEPSLPRMDRLGMTVEGLRFSAESYFPDELVWVGLDSAAPFEAAGCGSEDYFSSGELQDMGLPSTKQRFTFMVEATSFDVVRWSAELVTPEVSTLRIERTQRVENAEKYVTLIAEGIPQDEGKHIDSVIRVEDSGFVAARNALCAKRLAVSEQEFVDRHIAAVKRLALVWGAVPGDEFVAAYRDYATKGGSLELRSKPMTTIPEEQWSQFTQDDQFKMRNVTFTRGEKVAPLAMSFVDPKPLPDELSIEGQLVQELEIERSLALGLKARGANARARRAPQAVAALEPPKPALPKSRVGEEIQFAELKDLVGKRVKINTPQMLNRVATVERFSKAAVTLRVHFVGGSATYEFAPENLKRIVIM